MMLRKSILLLVFIITSMVSFAQELNYNAGINNYCIEGSVYDSLDNKALPKAYVEIIFRTFQGKTPPVVYTISDMKGYFRICSPKPIKNIRISISGYENKNITNKNFTDTLVKLDKVILKTNITEIPGASAKTKKDEEPVSIEKKTYSVSQNVLATGGTAIDALKQIPAVNVDDDGTISLRGSGNVTIYINGKQSSLSGADRQTLLLQIPAANIESIDVNTNPGAKQDAEGQSGIINIILKQNTSKYKNGNITIGVGNRNKYNGTITYNSSSKKLNLSNTFSFRQNDIRGNGYNLRNNHFNGNTSSIDQYNNSDNLTYNYTLTRNIEYTVNKSLVISTTNIFAYNSNLSKDKNRIELSDKGDSLYQVISRNNRQTNYTKNIDAGVSARKTFDKPSHNLYTLINFSTTGNNIRTYFVQNELSTLNGDVKNANPYLLYNSNRNVFSNSLFQLDYTKPLKTAIKLETGVKFTGRNLDNNFTVDTFDYQLQKNQPDISKSNHFIYSENVSAAYCMITHALSPLIKYNAGLRVENTGISGDQKSTGEKFSNNYTNLFPSGNINFLLQDKYNIPDIQVSYSKRINRPGQRELNPFINFNDPYNLSRGNPMLKAELTDAAELAAIYNTKKIVVTATVYARQTNRPISRFSVVDSNGIATISQVNLGYNRSTGGELIVRFSPIKNMKVTLNGNLYKYIVAGNVLGNNFVNERLSYSGKALLSYQFWKKTDVQLSFNYMGPNVTPQGTMKSMYGLEVGIRKDIVKDKLSLSLNLSDVFNNRRFAMELYDPAFTSSIYRKRETRILTFSITWKYGQSDNQTPDKKPKPQQQERPADTDF